MTVFCFSQEMNRFRAFDFWFWIIGSGLISVFCQYAELGWSWTIGSLAAFALTALTAAPEDFAEKENPRLHWFSIKNDTSGESPFIVMPPTDPATQFDGHSTYITQAGYDAMLRCIEQSGAAAVEKRERP